MSIKDYEGQGFNEDQMYAIRIGLNKGLDVSIYAKPEFDAGQMWEAKARLRTENMHVF